MIICMNIGTDGERYIAHIEYNYNEVALRDRVTALSEYYSFDEVYVMGFNCNCKELIDEVVLRGCRV